MASLLLMAGNAYADGTDTLWESFLSPRNEARTKHSAQPYTSEIDMRSGNESIKLWDPLTGERRFPRLNRLSMAPYQALFLICR